MRIQTRYLHVDKENPDYFALSQAAEIIRQGGLVAFPTETVYGLGANGLDARAVAGIFRAKGRPADNPLILHIAEVYEMKKLAAEITGQAARLMDTFWPGPLTVVVKRTRAVPDIVTGGLDTVGIRLPDSRVARDLIRLAATPVAAPSANASGRPSPTDAQAVAADLDGKIDAIIDAGSCQIGVESTVVDCTGTTPMLLRPGGVTLEMLTAVVGPVAVDPAISHKEARPRSPGMKYTHYAPAAPLWLVDSAAEDLLLREIRRNLEEGKRVGAIISREMALDIPGSVTVAVYGSRRSPSEIAEKLYGALRYFDTHPVDVIFAEGLEEKGIGLAIMNRLRKAAGGRMIHRRQSY